MIPVFGYPHLPAPLDSHPGFRDRAPRECSIGALQSFRPVPFVQYLMALPTTPPILSELRSSTSSINQVAALRALKNEIIGHEQKKRDWVGLGVLAPLARILNTPRANGKRRESNGNRSAHHGKPAFGRTDEEEARLQAIIVVGSLASGMLHPHTASDVYDNSR